MPLADVEKQAKFQDKFELWLRSRCEELNPKALVGLALHQVATGHALYRAQDWLEQRDIPPEMKGHLTEGGAVYGLISRIGSDYNIREHFLREWIKLHGDSATE